MQAKQRFKLSRLTTACVRIMALLGLSTAISLSELQSHALAASSVRNEAIAFNCNESEATIRARGGASVTVGQSTIYIGYQQVSANNKDPRLIRFDAGRRVWCKTNYEVTGDDSTGYGLVWNGGNIYAVFTATGTQGRPSQDFRRFATNGWLTNYGSGGGAKVAILTRINPANGNIRAATFLSSVLTNGRTNSMQVNSLALRLNGNLIVGASSWSYPRRANHARMSCNSASPYPYTIEFTPNLDRVIRARAVGCR
ncbi:hypothetical protein [Oscillatoria sp. FACHB-1407]|uniref:hypothetical protein n=1 Tax=Oscillatoria sp. FACHB-1407 TaxID=2692847 RepID=UPI0018EFBAA3|nr:hypothetical protein [Oscillatoria sp. FACHB-1407]